MSCFFLLVKKREGRRDTAVSVEVGTLFNISPTVDCFLYLQLSSLYLILIEYCITVFIGKKL